MTTLLPKLERSGPYWMMVVAVLGTTISPYLFFWQAAQEAEQRHRLDARNGSGAGLADRWPATSPSRCSRSA